jgi:glycogen phosphorylase
VRALQLADDDIWRCHQAARSDLIAEARARAGVALDPGLPILGFARRMTGYKRPMLLFRDLERLSAIAARCRSSWPARRTRGTWRARR